MLQAVLFDLGDTLFKLETDDPKRYLGQGIQLAYRRLVEKDLRLPPERKYLRKIARAVGWAYLRAQLTRRELRLLDLIRRTHRKMGIELNEKEAEEYARLCHQPFRPVFNPASGARETLQRVRAGGYSIGLVSNTIMISQALDEDLEAAGVIEYFDVRVYSSDVGYAKPHPLAFQVALDRLGVAAADAMFIGDLIHVDVKGAKRLGMTTVLMVPDGHVPAGRYRPDHIVRRITEVPTLLPGCRAPCTLSSRPTS
jgi:HAD superfamily hydrolase (TIGR01509 family)